MPFLFAFLILQPVAWALILSGWLVYTWRPKQQWGAAVVAFGLFMVLVGQVAGMLPGVIYFLGGEMPGDWFSYQR